MQPFGKHHGLAVALDRANVDTDQIIPKQFLKRIERTGFGQYLFYDWRFDESGAPRPDFVLNQPRYAGASILVAGRNFGCGSSREHAPWALADYGFRCLIAPSFADIFANNCLQNGLLTVTLAENRVAELRRRVQAREGYRLTVDLGERRIFDDQGFGESFAIEAFRRRRLLEGLDDIGMTLRHEAAIAAWEARKTEGPRLPAARSGE